MLVFATFSAGPVMLLMVLPEPVTFTVPPPVALKPVPEPVVITSPPPLKLMVAPVLLFSTTALLPVVVSVLVLLVKEIVPLVLLVTDTGVIAAAVYISGPSKVIAPVAWICTSTSRPPAPGVLDKVPS